jgi:hypothetical protein
VGDDEVDAKEAALAGAMEDAAQADRDLLTARIDWLALRGELLRALGVGAGGETSPRTGMNARAMGGAG